MACTICFEDFETEQSSAEYLPSLTCIDSKCNAELCNDCFNHFLKVCDDEKSMVKCVGKNCSADYSYKVVKPYLDKEANDLYRAMIERQVAKILNGDLIEDANRSKLVERIRKEKTIFIKTEFPIAIQKMIDVLYKKELKKVSTANKKKINSILSGGNSQCPSYYCTGNLNREGLCFICQKSWCLKCEAKIEGDHTCKKEDLASVATVSDCVKCPKCNVSVIRSFGCNFITCAICKTNFDYTKGTVTVSGNHDDLTITINSVKLSDRKDIEDETRNLIMKLESLSPNPELIYKRMKLAYKNKRYNEIHALFDRYNTALRKSSIYSRSIAEVGEMYQAKKFNLDIINLMIQTLN